jgi:hypothetical protein
VLENKKFFGAGKFFGVGVEELNSLFSSLAQKSQNTTPEYSVQTVRRSSIKSRRVPDQDAPVFQF